MFEMVIVIHLVRTSVTFISSTRYPTMVACEEAIPQGYDEIRRSVLDHLIEKFEVDKTCRPVEEGA